MAENYKGRDCIIKMKLKTYIIIPARYASTRFPGKPLVKLVGKPMIQWVYEAAIKVVDIEGVYVATDDDRIYKAVSAFGGKCLMTSDKHQSGSERLAECADILGLNDSDVILNIQGDEPLITPQMIGELGGTMEEGSCMGTLKEEITDETDIANPNIVKVVTDVNDYAIYFSRNPIPYKRNDSERLKYYRHVGVYGYTAGFLKNYIKMPKSYLEEIEGLEQLRVLENGYKIKVLETKHHSIGIDTPEQVKIVEEKLYKEGYDES
jgi:3-deoxy-manno-octulosonate cytidylyltransferase (CMP-KDO synthetase)